MVKSRKGTVQEGNCPVYPDACVIVYDDAGQLHHLRDRKLKAKVRPGDELTLEWDGEFWNVAEG